MHFVTFGLSGSDCEKERVVRTCVRGQGSCFQGKRYQRDLRFFTELPPNAPVGHGHRTIKAEDETVFCFLKQKEEKRIYSKFHPSNILLFFVFHSSKTQRRREKGIYSKFHPPSNFSNLLLFFVFPYSKIRGVETRGLGGGAAPPILPVVNWKEGRREKGL